MPVTKFPDPDVTTNARVASHLRASLQQHGVFLGTQPTLGNLLDAALALGATLDDPLESIEFGCAQTGDGRLHGERGDSGGWRFLEGRR